MHEELKRRAERRRLIFSNICNGVHPEQVKAAFQLSDLELRQEVFFVLRKINERNWRKITHGAPGGIRPIQCEDYAQIRANAKPLMATLDAMPDGLLASTIDMPPIQTQTVDEQLAGSPDFFMEVNHKMLNSHVLRPQ